VVDPDGAIAEASEANNVITSPVLIARYRTWFPLVYRSYPVAAALAGRDPA